jgi:hypothetical protein
MIPGLEDLLIILFTALCQLPEVTLSIKETVCK